MQTVLLLLLPALAAPGATCFCNSIWLQGHEEALLIAWNPEQIISEGNIRGRAAWGVAAGSGAWMCSIVWVITQWLPPAVYCCAMCTPRYKGTWGIYSVPHYQNLNCFADKVYPKWNHISIDYPPPTKPNTHHRPKLMRDKKPQIREFRLAGCSFALLYTKR